MKIDTAAPVTGDDAPDGWQGGPVTVTLSPTDAGSGISGGLAKTEYKLDGAATWSSGTSVAISGDGVHTLVFRSSDAIGNLESASRAARSRSRARPRRPATTPTPATSGTTTT